jgi:N6-L-threonylcarbamoyladenine synthase
VVDEVMIKLNYYLQKYPAVKFVTIGGGVSANRLLRNEIKQVSKPVFLPELKYANDNAAMIALYAYLTIQ